MRVKVGNRVYDSEEQPVMVVLSDSDKKNIAEMLPECTMYTAFPEYCTGREIEEWMKGEGT